MSEHLDHGEREPMQRTSEVSPGDVPEAGPQPADVPETEPPAETGHRVVDEVLQTMTGLQQQPVEEHVAIFEAAHEKLRAALSEADAPPGGPSDR